MTTLNRDAVPIGDDIEPVEESRVDVETGYEEEEESLKSEIPTVETNLKNPMRRADKNEKIVDLLFTGIGVLFVSKLVVLGNIFKCNRWRKKEENEQSYRWYLLITFSRHRKMHTRSQFFDSSRPTDRVKWELRVANGKRFHTIPHFISCRLENPCESREWTECESIPRSDEPRHCERNKETMQKSQDFV